MARQKIGLREPTPAATAKVRSTSRRRPLYRACSATHPQPWWYSTRTGNPSPGRFDLEEPSGTCYWALDAGSAIIEATADPDQLDPPVITYDALLALAVWRADDVPGARSKLADLTERSTARLTDEIATIVPYTLPWAWADALVDAGFRGLLYRARFAMAESVALFGPAGQPTGAPAADPSSALDHLHEVPDELWAGTGSVGRLDDLEQAPPP